LAQVQHETSFSRLGASKGEAGWRCFVPARSQAQGSQGRVSSSGRGHAHLCSAHARSDDHTGSPAFRALRSICPRSTILWRNILHGQRVPQAAGETYGRMCAESSGSTRLVSSFRS
jgi:hypothetical protein